MTCARLFPLMFRIGITLGVIGIAVALASLSFDPDSFLRGWLFGFEFWIGMSLGSLAILLFHYAMGGAWGVATRRIFEAGAMTMPLMAFAFLPILTRLPAVYIWARPEILAADPVLLHKSNYLNPAFFSLRAAGYLALWSVLAWLFFRGSSAQDRTASPRPTQQLVALSGPGIVLLILSGSFAWMDWLMSLEPHWYSSIYPLMVMSGQAASSFAFVTVIAALIADDPAAAPALNAQRFHDLGSLLFTFVFFWAYLNFAQLIVIWSGNAEIEIAWYLSRLEGGWTIVAAILFAIAFVVPFFLLLFRARKRDPRRLARVAVLVFVSQILNAYWLQAPAFQLHGMEFHVAYIAAFCGIGGLWLAQFAWLIQRRPILPVRAPEFPNVLAPITLAEGQ